MASRSPVYARPASMALCTAAITSPAPEPSIVKPRIRSLRASMSAFMKPRVSPVVRARRTELMGRRATRRAIPRGLAPPQFGIDEHAIGDQSIACRSRTPRQIIAHDSEVVVGDVGELRAPGTF